MNERDFRLYEIEQNTAHSLVQRVNESKNRAKNLEESLGVLSKEHTYLRGALEIAHKNQDELSTQVHRMYNLFDLIAVTAWDKHMTDAEFRAQMRDMIDKEQMRRL